MTPWKLKGSKVEECGSIDGHIDKRTIDIVFYNTSIEDLPVGPLANLTNTVVKTPYVESKVLIGA